MRTKVVSKSPSTAKPITLEIQAPAPAKEVFIHVRLPKALESHRESAKPEAYRYFGGTLMAAAYLQSVVKDAVNFNPAQFVDACNGIYQRVSERRLSCETRQEIRHKILGPLFSLIHRVGVLPLDPSAAPYRAFQRLWELEAPFVSGEEATRYLRKLADRLEEFDPVKVIEACCRISADITGHRLSCPARKELREHLVDRLALMVQNGTLPIKPHGLTYNALSNLWETAKNAPTDKA